MTYTLTKVKPLDKSLERIKPTLKQINWDKYEDHQYRGIENETKYNPVSAWVVRNADAD
ncbi:hypothetical protein H6G36_25595 [Anabaena minutissima FACHB-250]|nr:hypothetical protein [Anabaena minutissima FACHB-250]